MLLICPVHTPKFLTEQHLGVEAHIGRYDVLPNWEQYVPFVYGVHLPYANLNLAALDDAWRQRSIETLKTAIDTGCCYPVDRMVMHLMGIEALHGEVVGNYERMIEGIRAVADYAATKKIILCLENQALHMAHRKAYGSMAEEWFQIYTDVCRDNVMLTLDTSHAATGAATKESAQERFAYLYEYLKHPEWIGRVHWSDAKLTNREAFMCDMHLIPGEGDLPLDFHRAIKRLDVIKTLEQKRPEADVLRGLAFIEAI
ncbi:MAG: sugar phosphate isomerase/epimerase [Clostridia bacterium]|nr:sugar phosphate isomerase/epimerase [Clostridia bacterium]